MIYSQSFFFSAPQGGLLQVQFSRPPLASGVPFLSAICFHFLQKAILFSVTVGLCVLFAVVGARSKRHPSDGPVHS